VSRPAAEVPLRLAADWPIEWDELERFYCEAERRLGVSGEPGPFPEDRRSQPYPMAPMTLSHNLRELKAWAEKSGIPFWGTPQAKNTVAYGGRAACIRCNTCSTVRPARRYSPDFTFKRLLTEKKITLHDRTLVRKLVLEKEPHGSEPLKRPTCAIPRKPSSIEANDLSWPQVTHGAPIFCCSQALANRSGTLGCYMNGHAFLTAQIELDAKIYPGMNDSTVWCRANFSDAGRTSRLSATICASGNRAPAVSRAFVPATESSCLAMS